KEQLKNEHEDKVEIENIQKELKQIEIELDRFAKAIAEGVNPSALSDIINQRINHKSELESKLKRIELEKLKVARIMVTQREVDDVICYIKKQLFDSSKKE
ncbi:MAG: hypothetical protein NUV31_08000, partial [Dehalococcoidales bacterium]|nr:hypothetical protein [Dehalococcoidales bacterium]